MRAHEMKFFVQVESGGWVWECSCGVSSRMIFGRTAAELSYDTHVVEAEGLLAHGSSAEEDVVDDHAE